MKFCKLFNIYRPSLRNPVLSVIEGTRYERRDTSNGLTLVEVLIVVAILGILAAVAIPEFSGHSQKAKESAAKDNLRILRQAIGRYAIEHNGIAPGYPSNNTSEPPIYLAFYSALKVNGNYLSDIPQNPYNQLTFTLLLTDNEDFPANPIETETYGWIYKPATKEIRLNWSGTDLDGNLYFDY